MRRRILDLFTSWFCSGAGVWQTAGITLAIVVLEATHALPDPHGFWLLYWLTVYSAVTQPALAHSGAVQGERMEALEAQNARLLAQIEALLEHHGVAA